MPQGEPLELQLQRERVARTQVEALLESTRLQLIEMEIALRGAREEATRCIAKAVAPPPPPREPSALPAASPSSVPPAPLAASPPSATPVAAVAPPAPAPPAPAPTAAAKPRPRRAAPKPAASSLADVARAAEAIERAARTDAAPAAATAMSAMSAGSAAGPILSTLELYQDDNRAIVKDFVEHLQTRIGKMQACYGSGNITELKWHVTWIREHAAAAGFALLTLPAADLEMAIESDAKDQIGACLDHVINQAERVSVESVRR